MSKFFAEGNISDDSDESEERVEQNNNKAKKNKFDVEDEFHDHDKGRVLLAESEKKKAMFKKIATSITTTVNNQDFDKAWDYLQEMLKEVEKSAKFIQKEGYPPAVLRTIKFVNEQVLKIDPETKKKMKNPKSFNIMKQKLKNKIIPEYAKLLEEFVDEPEEESSSESSVSSSEEESESEVYKSYLNSDDPMIRRKYWLKRPKKQSKPHPDGQGDEKPVTENPAVHAPAHKAAKEKIGNVLQIQKKEELRIADAKEAEARIKTILKQFAKLSDQDKREQYLENLDVIIRESKKYREFQRLSILLVDIPIRIEVNRQMRITHFSRESWLKLFNNVKDIFTILRETEDEELLGKVANITDNDETLLGISEKQIYDLLKTFLMNLERELNKSFDFLENSELQYSERLQDLIKFVDFLYKLSRDMIFKDSKAGLERSAAEICFKVLENMYFMSKQFMDKISESSPDLTFTELADEEMLEELGRMVLALEQSEYTTKTILYMVYNHAVNRRDKAKDLLSMTNIADTISTKDYYTQACFNRAMVQLGISAFHQGNLYETQQILSDICGLGKNREQNKDFIKGYLAQTQRNDKDLPRHRALPYYLHLNVDMIEAIELIASMVLEVPYTLSEGSRISSKTFKRLFYEYERSHFIAEPLKYRDLVYAASNELKLGNWKQCFDYLLDIKIWKELGESDEARENLKNNMKQTALKCYILANKKCFRCISLANLAQKFELDLKTVRRLVCKWINHKEKEKDFHGTITEDDYLNIIDKRREKQSEIKKICEKLFVKLEDIAATQDQLYKQKLGAAAEQEEEDAEPEAKTYRKVNQAITDKLKNILSRRTA